MVKMTRAVPRLEAAAVAQSVIAHEVFLQKVFARVFIGLVNFLGPEVGHGNALGLLGGQLFFITF